MDVIQPHIYYLRLKTQIPPPSFVLNELCNKGPWMWNVRIL